MLARLQGNWSLTEAIPVCFLETKGGMYPEFLTCSFLYQIVMHHCDGTQSISIFVVGQPYSSVHASRMWKLELDGT